MMVDIFSFAVPAFIAGLLMFFAPCTFPLVPSYLAFIAGVSLKDLQDPEKIRGARRKIFFNALFYVLGFTLVFMLMGSAFGFAGIRLIKHREILSRVGAILVILFGVYMSKIIDISKLNFLNSDHRFNLMRFLKPGKLSSSFLFGATFAFAWSPCIGPVLGSILSLAATTASVYLGTFLLFIFSVGMGLPFLLIALGVGGFAKHISRINKYLNIISVVGGFFLIFIGILLLTKNFGVWGGFLHKIFSDFLSFEGLMNFY